MLHRGRLIRWLLILTALFAQPEPEARLAISELSVVMDANLPQPLNWFVPFMLLFCELRLWREGSPCDPPRYMQLLYALEIGLQGSDRPPVIRSMIFHGIAAGVAIAVKDNSAAVRHAETCAVSTRIVCQESLLSQCLGPATLGTLWAGRALADLGVTESLACILDYLSIIGSSLASYSTWARPLRLRLQSLLDENHRSRYSGGSRPPVSPEPPEPLPITPSSGLAGDGYLPPLEPIYASAEDGM